MLRHLPLTRRLASALVLAGLIAAIVPVSLSAQGNAPTLFLRPHCELMDQTACPLFDVSNPTMLVTPPRAPGQTLDMDIVLSNPTQDAISKIRVWLTYDAEALEGLELKIAPAFPTAVPGEADFSAISGYVKIAASATPGKEPKDTIIPIAHLVFGVKPGSNAVATPLSFYDSKAGTDGHTVIITTTAPTQNLLAAPLGTLLVRLSGPAAPVAPVAPVPAPDVPPAAPVTPPAMSSSAATSSGPASSAVASAPSTGDALVPPVAAVIPPTSSSAPSSSSASVPAGTQTSFPLIQVQNVRVGTKDNLLYVTWDLLNHPKLQGYNVYFGTLQGRYLQRRSVSVAARGTVIRDLPIAKTYYVAVRGVNDQNQETTFSTEVSVEIGNPSTASSPVIGSLADIGTASPQDIAPGNPVEYPSLPLKSGVPGKSGAPSGILLLLLGSGVIGALFACRRQVIAGKTLPV